ncbi:OB-fold nucleic acid binding domain-containing protein [uncultured Methanobrevibacter sp.]|uniref:OB-fold nucleic acid binding domain-containing protein n=1 Tax=uncultured Methanobrevibacter sp. TaxID=253161 RepID=UPI002631AB39|nr:OB-fold nucleic acid binding domain-containing protein [uncultured Methanobrevibacter sp.]
MQEEILQLYEKIKDQLSEEEFNAEIEKLRENYGDVGFMNDMDLARMILENYGVEVPEVVSAHEDEEAPVETAEDDSTENDDDTDDSEPGFVMTEELQERYDKIKDQITEEEFFARMQEFKDQNAHASFMGDVTFADMVVGEYRTEEVEVVSEKPEFSNKTISDLEDGSKDVSVTGRVVSISNKKSFKTRKGAEGELCNVELQDNTGSMRCTFWTQNMPLLKKFNEGDIIQIKNVDIKDGFSGLEATLRPRSSIVHMEEDTSKFPAYEEEITDIADIEPDTKVNIIARILRIPTIRSYEKNGKQGKVASLELQDATGKITYTLWNKNVELIESLGLEDGDTVKILSAQSRERLDRDGMSEISLTHWDGRIIKGDFEVPEIQQEFTPIGDLSEQKDVSIKGVVVRLQDIKTFLRKKDNTEGRLRNFDVGDNTGSIRVTVWGDDTALPINKGDIVKIIGGDVRFDDYTESGYSMNTGFNTQISINPNNLTDEELDAFEAIREQLRPVPIGSISEIDDDGKEVDIIGRILSINDINEFQRDDGTVGIVRSVMFADESGKVQLSFWNERAREEFVVGDAYQIENARTRLGMMSVDLNIGGGSRVIKLSEEEASARFIPELSTLEKTIYNPKKIEDLDEDEEDTIIIGRIIEINDVREFDRDTGDVGHVRNIEIADDTGTIRVALWDKDATKEREIGDGIKLQNPRLALNMDNRLEANVSRATTILEPSESELAKLPSIDELMEAIFAPKSIESLLEDDTNVCVTGTIIDVSTERVILKKCPNCRSNVEETIDEYICDNCGHTFDEPDYLLMVPTRIEDDTGDIQVTFFDKLAEELIGMKKEEIISLIDDGYGIEDKLQDLNGLTVEIIANVSFDEFNEENRLSPKKILNKYF